MDDNKELTQYVLEFQNGNKDAFQKIYELSYRKVYFTALKLCKNEDDAEDILQDSYIQVMNKISGLKNPDSFISWLNAIVANNARSMLRKNNPKLFDSTENEEYVLDSIEDTDEEYHPSEDVEKDELRAEIIGLIDNLSDEKRAAVILYYYNEMTTKQIAQSLDSNENTIKSRLVQAKKDLTKGVQELEKQNKKLRGVAPMPLILWAIRGSAKKSTEAFTLSGGAAATYTAITATTGITVAGATTVAATTGITAAGAATAASGVATKIAGFSIAQKVISGIVVAGIVTGGAVGTKEIIENKGGEENNTTAVVAETVEQTAKSITEQATTDFVFESTSETGLTSPKSTSQTQTNESATRSEAQTELSTSATTSTVVPGAVSSTRVTSTTRTTTKTTTKATTKAAAKSTTKATTTKATTKKTTLGNATVTITLYEDGNLKQNKTVTIDSGSSFSRADAANAIGVDMADVVFRSGSSISNAQAGGNYSFVIDS